MWDLGSLIRDGTQAPLALEAGVLTTESPGKYIFITIAQQKISPSVHAYQQYRESIYFPRLLRRYHKMLQNLK